MDEKSRKICVAVAIGAAGVVAGGVLAATLSASAESTGTESTGTGSAAAGTYGAPGGPGGVRGGGGDPSQPQRSDEKLLTGTTKTKVTDAVKAKYPSATIQRVETDSDGVYEAHVLLDGTPTIVQVGGDFTVTGTQTGPAGPGGPGGHGGPGAPADQGAEG